MIAYLTHENKTYFAQGTTEGTSFDMAVFRLIDGIYFYDPENARRIVRNRIYYTGELSISDSETIRVAAKRASRVETAPDLTNAIDLSKLNPAPAVTDQDREISCTLKTLDGKLLASHRNTNTRIRTRHAEINLLLELGNRKIMEPTVFHSTLKPCAMCASHLYINRERFKIESITYDHDDPGKLGTDTVLTPGSAARRRYQIPEHPLFGSFKELKKIEF